PMYDSLSSDCKTYLSITGGSHCQFAAYNLLCSIGESSCSPSPTITPSSQQTITFGLLLDWLDFYLKNDCNAGIDFQNSITIGMGITSNQNCMLICTGTDVVNYSSIKKIYIYPSIFNDKTFIKFNSNLKNGQLIIYNSTGQKVKQKKNITGKEIIFYRENLPVGIYFLHVIDEEEIIGIQKVVVY
ncbi:MAG: T9SS type A sorting domain-containing protein, partial [Nitrosopumilus sp.]|nr:T9SS type A sorting domain-containing protein [Nitrosopumilus sp.]